MKAQTRPLSLLQRSLMIAFAYVIACGVAALTAFVVASCAQAGRMTCAFEGLSQFVPIAFAVVAAYALPGFVLLRWALGRWKLNNPMAFGVAGFCCAMLASVVASVPQFNIQLDNLAFVSLPGLAAGLACFYAERVARLLFGAFSTG